ncbi:MAG: LPS-assembly protein LptD [Verrucomicrobiales bacterium]|nr:LPS-assembly protein LptD [Verrucomicrobiales bacterium]
MTTLSKKQLHRLAGVAFCAWLAFTGSPAAFGQAENLLESAAEAAQNLQIESNETSFDETLGIAKATGNVRIRYGEVVIEAEQAEYHQSSGKVFARDNVRVFKDGSIFTGQEIIYDTNTGDMTSSDLRSALAPLFYEAADLSVPKEGSEKISMGESYFTTHDSSNPNFRIRAKSMDIYPGDRVVMKGVKFYTGDTPIFWFPYLSQPLDDELGYYFVPGFSTPWGAFLLNQYGFMLGDHTLAQAHLDYRSERGLAGGIEFKSQRYRGNPNFGRLNLYYASDDDPQSAYSGRTRTEPIDSDRYRINFQHRVYLPGPDKSTLYLDIDINKLSDQFMYEDFFPAEYRTDPQPDNILNLVKTNPWGTVSLLGRFQLNDFFDTDERLELAVDFTRTPLSDTGFFYDGFTTAGILSENVGDTRRRALLNSRDELQAQLLDLENGVLTVRNGQLVDADGNVVDENYNAEHRQSVVSEIERLLEPRGYGRFETYHEVLYPISIGNALTVVPRVGGGYSNYSDIDNPGIDSFDRTIGHAGVDTSMKFSKKYGDVQNETLGIDGIIHVFQPYLNYSYVSTDEIGSRFTPIDRLTPTTRLRPLDLPMFTATDGINDWQIARIGMSNRFLTRRNGGTHNWLSFNTYFENYIEDPEFNRDFSNLFNEIAWSPLPWLSARVDSQLPVFGEEVDFTENTSSLNFMPTEWFQFSVGHYYLEDHPFFRDSNLMSFGTYTRLSDQWGLSTVHRFEADDNTLEIQQYQIHRDLSSWTASLGAIVRDNRRGEDEYGILLSLTLKAFPKITVPLDLEPGGVQ